MKFKDGRAERIEAVTKIWAAGVQASPLGKTLAEQTGAPLDRAGRIGVNPDLTLPGSPGGLRRRRHDRPRQPPRRRPGGDPGREVRRQGDRRPAQGQARAEARSSTSTRARWPSSAASGAVAMVGKLRLTGVIAWLMWLGVHLVYITGFKNRRDRGPALVRLVPRPRSRRAHHHRAADLRAQRPGEAARWCHRPGLRPGRLRGGPRAAGDHPARRARGEGGRGGPPDRRPASAASTTRATS